MNIRFVDSRSNVRVSNICVLPEDLDRRDGELRIRVYETDHHPEGCMKSYKRVDNGSIPTYELVDKRASRVHSDEF